MSVPQNMTQSVMRPCLVCPDGQEVFVVGSRLQDRPPVAYILNDGMSQARFWKLVASHINGELRYGQPVGNADGSLEFPAEKDGVPLPEPDEIYGYERDAVNRRLFRPAWNSCIERVLGVFIRDEQLVVAGRCNHFKSDQFMKPTTLDICRDCPIRRPAQVEIPTLRTAEEFLADAERKAAPALKAKLGDDIFERAQENLRRWAKGLPPLKQGEKPETTDRIESEPSQHDSAASSAT